MKKFLSLVLSLIMLLSAISTSAAEELEFNIDNVKAGTVYDDNTTLMSDTYAELERRLIEGWTNMEAEIDISDLRIHRDDISLMYGLVFFENPLFYYVERSFGGTLSSTSGMMGAIKPRYLIKDKTEIEETWAQIDKATEEILLYISPDMTDFEKVMAVHDYMVFNYVYDITDTDQTMMIILDKSGVCAAYSEAFIHMMNVLGIESTVVRSTDMGHIWNLVQIDNEWYHVDVTWDDVVPDRFAGVNHTHALLSTEAITKLGHYNFDMAGYIADSTLYDDALWRDEEGAIVTIDSVMYRVESNNLIDESGKVIYANLDGGDGWWNLSRTSGFTGEVFAGLCELNGILYFNTDEGIYGYNPETKEIDTVLEEYGICGIYADENVLRYNNYDSSTGGFAEAGSIKMADIKLAEPYYEDGEAVVRLYNDSDEPVWVISKGDTYKIETVTEAGVNTVRFDNGTEQTIYIWKSSLEPYFEKMVAGE